jgi:hypothetical protein
MSIEKHLVTVWNPSYGSDVMEAHVRLLRDLAQRFRSKEVEEDEVFVWWGKIRSVRRQSPLPHLNEIIALESQLGEEEANREMQLYLTDYRSLYVAHVGEITTEDVRKEYDGDHIADLYREDGRSCDFWFRLWDIRRLVSDDTLAVIEELQKLRNIAYGDMPVSIYGGMVNLPLIVTRPDGARYFESDARDQLTDGKYWVEFDAERSGLGSIERELRENCFGEEAWFRLDPGTRTFIATAEKVYRDHKADISLDFSPVLIDFAKAYEVQTNILLRQALAKVPRDTRLLNLSGKTVDAGTGGPFMLADLVRIIGESKEINQALKRAISREGEWFTASLPAILRELAVVRNPAAHSERIDRETVRSQRNRFLGIGCEGDLVRLAKVRIDDRR